MCKTDYFQLAFSRSPVPSVILQRNNNGELIITEVNASYLRLVRRFKEDLIGFNYNTILHHPQFTFQDSASLQNAIEKIVGTNCSSKIIQRVKFVDCDEEKFWHIETRSIEEVPASTTPFVLQTVTDITGSIMAGELNMATHDEQAEESTGLLLHSHPDAVFTLDVEGRFLRANRNLLKLAECGEEEISSMSFIPFVIPEERTMASEIFKTALKGEVINFEINTVTAKGNKKHLHVTNIPMVIQGEVAGVYVIAKDMTAEYIIRQQLQEEQQRREELINRTYKIWDSITDGFISLDRNWTISYWNKAAEKMFKIDRQSLIGRCLWDVFTPPNHPEFHSAYQKALHENVIVRFSTYSPRFNKHFDVNVYPSEEGLSVYFHDNSEKIETEKKVKESDEKYDIISKAISDAIYDWDFKTGCIRWNESIGPIFGYDASEDSSTEQWWVDKMHPKDFEKVNQEMHEAIKNQQSILKREYRFRCSDGKYKFIKDSCIIIYQNGMAVRITGAIKDIDDLKRINAENKRLADLINKVNSLIVISDQEMRILWVNEAFETCSGYSRAEVYGKRTTDVLHGKETNKKTVTRIKTLLAKGQSFSGEILNYSKSGEKYWIDLNCTPVFDEEEGLKGFVAVSNVITERKEREESLRKQTAALRHIAWLSSHEIRKPVANILGILNLFPRENTECESSEYVWLLEQATEELDMIVRDISQKINRIEVEISPLLSE